MHLGPLNKQMKEKGQIKAVAELVEELGGEVVGLSVLIDLKNLHGDLGFTLSSLIEYEVEE